jgi:ribosomal protein S27AE
VLKPGVLQDSLIEQQLYVWFGDREQDTCRRCGKVIQASAKRGIDEFHLQLSPKHLKPVDIHARLPSRMCPACGALFVDSDTTFIAKANALAAAWDQLLRAARASPRVPTERPR